MKMLLSTKHCFGCFSLEAKSIIFHGCFTLNFFFILVFSHEHSRFTGKQGKGEGIYNFTPLYHFDQLHGHLDISQAITAETSPLHITSS